MASLVSTTVNGDLKVTGSSNLFFEGSASSNTFEPGTRIYGAGITLTGGAYTSIFEYTVPGGLAGNFRFFVKGTTGNVVIPTQVDVLLNHSQDITIKSQTGNYTPLHVKVLTNNNEDCLVQIKADTHNSANVTVYIDVIAFGDGSVSFSSFGSYTGTSLEHRCAFGFAFSTINSTTSTARFVMEGNHNGGRLGVGTDDPDYMVDVRSTANDARVMVSTTAAGAYFRANSGSAGFAALELQANGSGAWALGQYGYNDFSIIQGAVNGNRRLTIDTNGNVGIGSTQPGVSGLDIAGKLSIGSPNNSYDLYNNGTTYLNGNVTVDATLSLTGGVAALSIINSSTTDSAAADSYLNIFKTAGSGGGSRATLRVGYDAANCFQVSRIRNNANIYINSRQSGSSMVFQIEDNEQMALSSGQLKFPDNKKIIMGASNDLQIYHDGNNWIDANGAGDLYLRNLNSSGDVIVQAGASGDVYIKVHSGETALKATNNGAVELYYNNTKTFQTTANGVKLSQSAASYLFGGDDEILAGQDSSGYYFATGNGQNINKPIFIGDNASYIRFKTSDADQVTIDGNGNVGIGITNPSKALHVIGAAFIDNTESTGGLTVEATSNANITLQAAQNTAAYRAILAAHYDYATPMTLSGYGGTVLAQKTGYTKTLLYASNAEQIRITTTGVGIGLGGSDPATKLHVKGVLSITGDGSNAVTFTESGAGLMTIATADDFVVDAAGDIRLDADGGDIRLNDNGVSIGRLGLENGDLNLASEQQDYDVRIKGNDGGSVITALHFDMSAGGAATFSSSVTATAFSGTADKSNMVTGGAFATTGSPGSVLEYQQAASITDTKLAPTTDWYNTIRMGHGNPYSYYSNTIAMQMTGTGAGQIKTQRIANNVAQGWRTVWDSGNDGSGSGLDADLLDGQHGSHYLAAANLTGTVPVAVMNKVLPTSGNYVWSNSTTAGNYTTGLQLAFVRGADGWPNYGSVLHVGARGGTDAGGDFQIYCGHGSGNGGNYLRVRNADNSATPTDSWTDWRTIWDSGNDGSGSGLDADKLDGLEYNHFAYRASGGTGYYIVSSWLQFSGTYGPYWNAGTGAGWHIYPASTDSMRWRAAGGGVRSNLRLDVGATNYGNLCASTTMGYGLRGAGVTLSTDSDWDLLINTDGNVGIGTTNPAQKLEVSGNIILNNQILTPSGSNLALNPNTGLVTVGGALSLTGSVTASSFSGSGASLTSLNASNISSGTVAAARLGSGSSITTKFLRGDNTWQTVSSGSSPNNSTITISTGTGITGSTSFTLNQASNQTISLACDLGELPDMTQSWSSNDEFIVLDSGTQKRKRSAEIFGSNAFNSTTIPTNNNQLTNGAGYTTNTGTMSSWNWGINSESTGANIGNGELVRIIAGTNVTVSRSGNDVTVSASGGGSTPNNKTITLSAGNGLSNGGAFTTNQSFNETITFNITGLNSSGNGSTVMKHISVGAGTAQTSSNGISFSQSGGISISASGSTVSFSSSSASDYRLKKNVTDFNSESWTKVKSVSCRKFDFDAEKFAQAMQDDYTIPRPASYGGRIGFIAHELEALGIDGAVEGEKDGVDENGIPIYQKVSYTTLVPVLWGALNEAIRKIEILESKVQALEDSS